MNWKRSGKKRSWPTLRQIFLHLPAGTEEKYTKDPTVRDVNLGRPRYEAKMISSKVRCSAFQYGTPSVFRQIRFRIYASGIQFPVKVTEALLEYVFLNYGAVKRSIEALLII